MAFGFGKDKDAPQTGAQPAQQPSTQMSPEAMAMLAQMAQGGAAAGGQPGGRTDAARSGTSAASHPDGPNHATPRHGPQYGYAGRGCAGPAADAWHAATSRISCSQPILEQKGTARD